MLPSRISEGSLEYDGGIIIISKFSNFGLSVTNIVSGVDSTDSQTSKKCCALTIALYS